MQENFRRESSPAVNAASIIENEISENGIDASVAKIDEEYLADIGDRLEDWRDFAREAGSSLQGAVQILAQD